MRLQVEAQLRTPGIIALVTFLVTRVLLSTQTRDISINIFPSTTLKEPGFNGDKDYSLSLIHI